MLSWGEMASSEADQRLGIIGLHDMAWNDNQGVWGALIDVPPPLQVLFPSGYSGGHPTGITELEMFALMSFFS